jgi:hypothetical protein
VLPKASLKLALVAGIAGLLAGYASHRAHPRARTLASLQAVEWFLSAGGASLLTSAIRRMLDEAELEVTERVVTVEETVYDRDPAGRR